MVRREAEELCAWFSSEMTQLRSLDSNCQAVNRNDIIVTL